MERIAGLYLKLKMCGCDCVKETYEPSMMESSTVDTANQPEVSPSAPQVPFHRDALLTHRDCPSHKHFPRDGSSQPRWDGQVCSTATCKLRRIFSLTLWHVLCGTHQLTVFMQIVFRLFPPLPSSIGRAWLCGRKDSAEVRGTRGKWLGSQGHRWRGPSPALPDPWEAFILWVMDTGCT